MQGPEADWIVKEIFGVCRAQTCVDFRLNRQVIEAANAW
jgi:hypothetical protein